MAAPKLLDLFCGAGGASMGYHAAGFDVTGVDIEPRHHYPFMDVVQDDALLVLRDAEYLGQFHAIHASPPCQPYSTSVVSRSSQWNHTRGKDEPALIRETHRLLVASGKPWVIENVMGALPHLPGKPFVLCGSMFGRPIPRHRAFSTSFFTPTPEHPDCRGLAKRSAEELGWEWRDMSVTGKGRRAGTAQRWAQLLGYPEWKVSQHEMAESVPPAYTEFIGAQLLTEARKVTLTTSGVRQVTCPNCNAQPGAKCTLVIPADSDWAKDNGKTMHTGACGPRWEAARG